MSDRLLNVPNVLTLTRLPLALLLFGSISQQWWLVGLIVFLIASITDWLDGYLARRLNQMTALGRNLDPLIDKVLTGGAFIYLMPEPNAELMPWMVTLVVGRELLITGLRGIMEGYGVKFGADALGKLKMVLQCVVLIAVLAVLWLRTLDLSIELIAQLHGAQLVLIYAMLAATLGSGVQYVVKAVRRWPVEA